MPFAGLRHAGLLQHLDEAAAHQLELILGEVEAFKDRVHAAECAGHRSGHQVTIHLDGARVNSCLALAVAHELDGGLEVLAIALSGVALAEGCTMQVDEDEVDGVGGDAVVGEELAELRGAAIFARLRWRRGQQEASSGARVGCCRARRTSAQPAAPAPTPTYGSSRQ